MFVLEAIHSHAQTGTTALINREEVLSFAELDARSEAFAAWLLERLGEDRTPIVLYGRKETDFLPCIYGALKSGRAYVPVDAVVPPKRLAEILADVKPRLIVDFSGLADGDNAMVVHPEELSVILSAPGKPVPRDTWVSGKDTAYILFTSGSTGRPKGIPITADNLKSFSSGLLPHMRGKEGDVILNQISYSFDVSCCSIYAGISRGMTLFTVDQPMLDNMASLMEYLGRSGLTTWVSTPSFAEVCVRAGAFTKELMGGLTQFLFCGEVLTHNLCDSLAERFPETQILNTYGPTEATVLVTAAAVTGEMRRDERSIPIGYPLDGVTLRLVDGQGTIIEQDELAGELLILGGSVGPGYLGQPHLTEKSFFTDEATGMRGYRTGDICYRKDGLYYYTGRVDNQLKLSGHRIELEDIENSLARLDNISRAAVVPVWKDGVVQYLAGFLLLEGEDGLKPLERTLAIKKQAALVLPPYMIPRKLIAVDSFPLNASGKVDKKELAKRLEKAATS